MTKRSIALRLFDIRQAIAFIEDALQGKTVDDYLDTMILRLSIERAIEIISEASRHIPDELKANHPDIHWRGIAGIGNVLRHDYQGVEAEIMWRAAIQDIPPLKAVIDTMIAALPSP
jgi:uncharacterized protein with HEPN domain